MIRFSLVLYVVLVSGGVQARDCGQWETFAYKMQLGVQQGNPSAYLAFEPKGAFQRSIKISARP